MKFGRTDYDEIFKDIECSIPVDEPVFLFRGTDPLVPRLLLNYATEMRLAGTDPKVADSVVAHAQRIMDWQRKHGSKHADIVHEDENTIKKKYRISELISNLEIDCTLKDNQLLELQELDEEVYGNGRFKIVMPTESLDLAIDNLDKSYDLVLGINKDKSIEILWMSSRIN